MGLRSKRSGAKSWAYIIENFKLSSAALTEIGQAMVEAIQIEVKKDLSAKGQLPKSQSFINSFTYRIKDGDVQLETSWPWIEMYIEGKDPFPMDWLTRQKGVYRVPLIQDDGTVLIRMAPLTTQDAWIHPGIARHTFLARAKKRSAQKAKEVLKREIAKALASGDPTL